MYAKQGILRKASITLSSLLNIAIPVPAQNKFRKLCNRILLIYPN